MKEIMPDHKQLTRKIMDESRADTKQTQAPMPDRVVGHDRQIGELAMWALMTIVTLGGSALIGLFIGTLMSAIGAKP